MGIGDVGDDNQLSATVRALRDVDVEDAFETRRQGERGDGLTLTDCIR